MVRVKEVEDAGGRMDGRSCCGSLRNFGQVNMSMVGVFPFFKPIDIEVKSLGKILTQLGQGIVGFHFMKISHCNPLHVA